METRQVLLVDAFTGEPTTGNPAGVVPDATGLSDDQLWAIADELGAGETAFLFESETADRRVRTLDPDAATERDRYGALAAHTVLFERGELDDGEYTVETDRGVRDVELKPDGTVWTELGDVDIREVDRSLDEVAEALGVDDATLRDVGADLPLAVADVGVPWLVVPINYFEHLSAVEPDTAAIDALCRVTDAEGLYAFTFDTIGGESTLHGRAFTPGAGRREEPATGTAAGACAAYVRRNGALDDTIEQVVVEQGQFLDRAGLVRIETDGVEVWVGGRGVTTLEGSITVPEAESDDDIIEL